MMMKPYLGESLKSTANKVAIKHNHVCDCMELNTYYVCNKAACKDEVPSKKKQKRGSKQGIYFSHKN